MNNFKHLSGSALAISLILVGVTSCGLLDGNTTIKLLWTSPIVFGTNVNEGVMQPFVYNNTSLICIGQQNQQSIILCKDLSTGQDKWKWTDLFPANNPLSRNVISLGSNAIHYFGSTFVLGDASKIYYINLNTGNPLRKVKIPSYFGFGGIGLTGLGETYFIPEGRNNFFRGSIQQQKETIYYSLLPNHPDEFVYPWHSIATLVNSDTLVVASFDRYNQNIYRNRAFYTLFNLTKNIPIYTVQINSDTAKDRTGGIYGQPIIYRGNVYFAIGNIINCFNLEDGKQRWQKEFPADFLFSGITLANDAIIGNCENEIMYCLDAESGTLRWQEKTSGTTRAPFYMNSVVYFVGGGDGLFHAVNTTSGKHIWKIPSPDANSTNNFDGYVTGADGKVFVSSYKNMYCYKAAQ